ncbi:Haloalkane dehalogenase [Rippkaea orientalis PCC 8801]|uniref:Haloalkane dehalogenase n=1 Tax=Rippkaea orientalis (strain PCC 8801 / RF-1) TaxID=41431 RepID=B7JZZ6_RIPO1|nr:alpha/beta fold hydrolase [Rippkaea orientalis]ACK66143.1 Haloalkane dehalogenase [Rippkaea orientalis PCC 8801]
MTEQSLTVGSLEWFYREVSPQNPTDKSPVMLLHGLPSHSYTWRNIMPVLAEKGFSAIAPDWIGSGKSAKPDKRDFAYTPQAYREALNSLIEALEIAKLSLVVQGFLASVGIQYALTYPDKIDRLIILNTPLSPDVKLPWLMQQWAIPFMGDMVTQDPLLVDRTLEGGSGFVISDEDLAVYRQPFLKSSAVGRALLATTKNLQLAASMTAIQEGFTTWEHPTLMIWGMADPWLSSESPEKLANRYGNVELIQLGEAKHYPQEHWGQEVSEAIVNFLRRQA